MIYLNDIPVTPTLFPDGTSQIWKLPKKDLYNKFSHIEWKFQSESELIHLAQLKMLLASYKSESTLTITYLPYGRQDKDVSNDATFALNTLALILNTLKFNYIYINDPHSDIALNLIHNSIALYPIDPVKRIQKLTNSDVLCYPDKGAVKKYSEIYLNTPFIYGEKVRDQSTGNILSYEVIGDCKDKNILIVDDICDGGMTFKILAKDLLEKGAKEVNLFVTHGIFSKGLRTLTESGIKRVFTVDGEIGETQNHITYRRL